MTNEISDATFGQRLRQLRKEAGLSQTALGDKIGVSKRVISYYEAKSKYPPAKSLEKIAAALQVSTDELLGFAATKNLDGRSIDGKMMQKFRKIQQLSAAKRKALSQVIDVFLAESDKNISSLN